MCSLEESGRILNRGWQVVNRGNCLLSKPFINEVRIFLNTRIPLYVNGCVEGLTCGAGSVKLKTARRDQLKIAASGDYFSNSQHLSLGDNFYLALLQLSLIHI